jgi:phage terminase small subunit
MASPKRKSQRGKPAADMRSRFVARYVELGFTNAKQAALDVGYSATSAAVTAHRILKRPDVVAELEQRKHAIAKAQEKAIAQETAKRIRKAAMSREAVARELKLIGQSSVEHYDIGTNGQVVMRNGAPRGAMRAVSKVKVRKRTVHTDKGSIETVETEYALWNKLGALQQTRELEGYDVPPPSAKGAQAGAVIEVLGGPMGFEVRAAVTATSNS